MISISGLIFSYPGHSPLFLNFSLEIRRGQAVTILGPSGCGKTTLLNLIGGLDRPDKGNIQVARQELGRLTDGQLSVFRNRTVGFIFQLNWLHPRLNAHENVMLPALVAGLNSRQAHERAERQLSLVGLDAFGRRFPAELSGGQVQRVAIARSLVMSPSLLLADEPTGNLDQRTGAEVLELISGLNEEHGLTVLLVTHEPAIRDYAHRTVRMEQGRFVGEELGPTVTRS